MQDCHKFHETKSYHRVSDAKSQPTKYRKRPLDYRKKAILSIAYKEIEKAAGQQFDPEIVRTFLTMPQMIWDDLAASINSGQFNRG